MGEGRGTWNNNPQLSIIKLSMNGLCKLTVALERVGEVPELEDAEEPLDLDLDDDAEDEDSGEGMLRRRGCELEA